MQMKSGVGLALLVVSAAGLGCHGPSSSCEGTMKSYASIIDSNSWDDLPGIIYAPERKKYGDRAIVKWVSRNYNGAKSFKFKYLAAVETGETCQAQSISQWHWKVRGKVAEDNSDEYTYLLHRVDGKWYMELPGTSKVQGW